MYRSREFFTAIIVNQFGENEVIEMEINNQTVADLVKGTDAELCVSINGRIIEKADFETAYLKHEDAICVAALPQGGGSNKDNGKQVLRLVAALSISYFTMGAGAVKAMQGSWMGIAANMAGQLLLTAILPSAEAELPNDTLSGSPSQIYSIDGAKNTSKDSLAVPLVFGEYRIAGNYINIATENFADFQEFRGLLNAGEGEIAGIRDIELNDEPIENYDAEFYTRVGTLNQTPIPEFRTVSTEAPIGITLLDTNDSVQISTGVPVVSFALNYTLPRGIFEIDELGVYRFRTIDLTTAFREKNSTKHDDWYTFGQGQSAEAGMLLTLPAYLGVNKSGLSEMRLIPNSNFSKEIGIDDINNYENLVVEGLSIEFVEHNGDGPPPVPPVVDLVTYQISGTRISDSSYDILGEIFMDQSLIYIDPVNEQTYGNLKISGNSTQRILGTIRSNDLVRDDYELVISRRTSESGDKDNGTSSAIDAITFTDFKENTLVGFSYVNTALVGVVARVDNQLNSIPKVTYINEGLLIDTYVRNAVDPSQYDLVITNSNNPAWIVYNLYTNQRWGGKLPTSRLIFEEFFEWAQHCIDNELTFNGVFDNKINIYEAVKLVSKLGRGKVLRVGSQIGVNILKARPIEQLFTSSSINTGTLKISWLPITDRANVIDCVFYDRGNKNKPINFRYYDPEIISTDQDLRPVDLVLFGVDNQEQALKECIFSLNFNKLSQTVVFEASAQSLSIRLGSVIGLQHEAPKWGVGGRLVSGDLNSLEIDREFTFQAGLEYAVLLQFDSVNLETITDINKVGAGDSNVLIIPQAPDPLASRIVIDGDECGILNVVEQSGSWYMTIDRNVTFSTSQSGVLYSTDAIITRNITNTQNTTTSITLLAGEADLPTVPQQYMQFSIGEVNSEVKKFLVTAISGKDANTRQVEGIEFYDEVFDDSVIVGNFPVFDYATPQLDQILELSGYTQLLGVAIKQTAIVINWNYNKENVNQRANVYMKVGDGSYSLISRVTGTTYTVDNIKSVDTHTLKVVAVRGNGQEVLSTSLTISVNVDIDITPYEPNNLLSIRLDDRASLTWTKNPLDLFNELSVVKYNIYSAIQDASDANAVTFPDDYTKIDETFEKVFSQSDLETSTKYNYAITSQVGTIESSAALTLITTPTAFALRSGESGVLFYFSDGSVGNPDTHPNDWSLTYAETSTIQAVISWRNYIESPWILTPLASDSIGLIYLGPLADYPSSPDEGDMFLHSGENILYVYRSGTWELFLDKNISGLTVQYSPNGEQVVSDPDYDWSSTFRDGTDLYMRQSVDSGANWTASILMSGEKGNGGPYIDFRFARGATAPALDKNQLTPTDWFDTVPSGTGKTWLISVKKNDDGTFFTGETWSDPSDISGEQGTPGEDAVYGSVTFTNTVSWSRDTAGTYAPATSTSTITAIFRRGDAIISTSEATATRSGTAITIVDDNNATGQLINISFSNNGSQAPSVIFTHDGTSIAVSQSLSLVVDGIKGTDSVLYQINYPDGLALREGGVESTDLSILQLENGAITVVNSGSVRLYDGATDLGFSRTVTRAQVTNSKTIQLRDGAQVLDSVNVIDVADGADGDDATYGTIEFDNARHWTKDKDGVVSPADSTTIVTAIFYRAGVEVGGRTGGATLNGNDTISISSSGSASGEAITIGTINQNTIAPTIVFTHSDSSAKTQETFVLTIDGAEAGTVLLSLNGLSDTVPYETTIAEALEYTFDSNGYTGVAILRIYGFDFEGGIRYSLNGGAEVPMSGADMANVWYTFEVDITQASNTIYIWANTVDGGQVKAISVTISVQGARGAGHFYATGESPFDDAVADVTPPLPLQIGDRVTISNGTNFSETKVWSGVSWGAVGAYIDSNLLVNGNVIADIVFANAVTVADSVTATNGDLSVHISATQDYAIKATRGANVMFGITNNGQGGVLNANIIKEGTILANAFHPDALEYIRGNLGVPAPATGGTDSVDFTFSDADEGAKVPVTNFPHGSNETTISVSYDYYRYDIGDEPSVANTQVTFQLQRSVASANSYSNIAGASSVGTATIAREGDDSGGGAPVITRSATLVGSFNIQETPAADTDYDYRVVTSATGNIYTTNASGTVTVSESGTGGATSGAGANDPTITIETNLDLTGGTTFSLNQAGDQTITIEHGSLAEATSVGSGVEVVGQIGFDVNGHVRSATTRDLSNDFYSKALSDSRYVELSGDTMGTLIVGGGVITASGATFQNKGLMRTGTIYLHEGGATPNASVDSPLTNVAGQLRWDDNAILTDDNHTGSFHNTYNDARYSSLAGGNSFTNNNEFSAIDISGHYGTSAIEINEVGLVGSASATLLDEYAPALAFHWLGRVQGQLALHNDGVFHFRDGADHDVYEDVRLKELYFGDNGHASFYSDVNDRIRTQADFFVDSTSDFTYLYSTVIYLGDSGGSDVRFRASVITANNWGITNAGIATFPTVVGDLTGNADTADWADTVDINLTDSGTGEFALVWGANDTLFSSSQMTYNRTAQRLTVPNLAGDLTGDLTGIASQVNVRDHTANNIEYPVVWHNNDSYLYESSNGMSYNPAFSRLTVPNFAGIEFISKDTGNNVTLAADYGSFSGFGILGNRDSFYVSNSGGDVVLNYGGLHGSNRRLSTTSTGVTIAGTAVATTFSGNLSGNATTATNLTAGAKNHAGSFLMDDPAPTLDWNANWRTGFYNADGAANAPTASGWYWGLKAGHSSNHASNRYGMDIVIQNESQAGKSYIRATGTDGNGVWQQIWTSENDGASSGLDADLLDGAHGSAFGKLAASQTWTGINKFSMNNGLLEVYSNNNTDGAESTLRLNGQSQQGVDIRLNTYDSNRAPFGVHIERAGSNGQTGNKAYLEVEGFIYAEEVVEISALKKKNITERVDPQVSLNKVVEIGSKGTAIGTLKDDETKKVHRWFIADEVLPIMPEVVNVENGEVEGLAYSRMLPDAYAAIAKQQEMIDKLMARVNKLEGNS